MENFSLSPLALFLQAGPVGKAVSIILLAASIWCWALLIEGAVMLARLRRAVVFFCAAQRAGNPGDAPQLLAQVVDAGRNAARKNPMGETLGERRQRVSQAMKRSAREISRQAGSGLGNLAIIASVSPFIGLFGTVWGVMTSFVGIAALKDTSLATVAPGVAEALAATAYGLFAAIPASIGYTRIGGALARIGSVLNDEIEAVAIDLAALETASDAASDRVMMDHRSVSSAAQEGLSPS